MGKRTTSKATVRIETIPRVPSADLGRLIRALHADGAINVSVVPELDRDRFTVIATFRE